MNRILEGFKYRTAFQVKWLLFGLAVYALAISATFYGLIRFSLISESEGTLVYRLFFLIITVAAFSMRFREDFDFFLALSFSRREIFYALLSSALALCLGVSVLIIAEKSVVDVLNGALGLRNAVDPFHHVSPYRTGNLFTRFAFFFSLSAAFSVFGILMGIPFWPFLSIST